MEKDQVEKLYKKWGGSIQRVVQFDNIFQKSYDTQLQSFLSSKYLLSTINQVAYDNRAQSHQWSIHRWPIVTGDEADYCR